MTTMPIAIIGGGNGGHCMAADLSLRGHTVSLYEHPDFAENFAHTLATKTIKLTGIGENGDAQIHTVTMDIEQALAGAQLVMVVIPASGHELFFTTMLPHLVESQTIVVWAGQFGALRLAQMIREQRPTLKVTIAETSTLPYGTRLQGPSHSHLLLVANMVSVAALPSGHTNAVVDALTPLFPVVESAPNVLVAAFNNPNPICHPPGALLNTGRIEYSGGDFYMYKEGLTHSVLGVIEALYREVQELGRACGYEVATYPEEAFREPSSIMGVALQAPENTNEAIANILGPKSVHDRYITEDLPFGLVPMSQLALKVGVKTPIMDSIVSLGSAVCGIDFWATGRTLASLGLAEMDAEAIVALVNS
ncbi:MAG: hypothetical protein ABR66_05390 [Microbacteriaceae bacterium BACL25 MAG-120322-bin65]|jgi:opine dehydrogenase|nr:MAG: hypothetical protein ABR66_05390 [Microbacteriaceae bacterium BACL25 MAG-120322-bin65]